jgi:hypothetical protein
MKDMGLRFSTLLDPVASLRCRRIVFYKLNMETFLMSFDIQKFGDLTYLFTKIS